MKVSFRLLSLMIALSLIVFACNDSDEEKGTDLNFKVPNFGRPPYIPINFAIYETKEDYGNNTNAIVSGRTEADKGTYTIPFGVLDRSKEYYIDYYSDDFKRNNWNGNITIAGRLAGWGGGSSEELYPTRITFLSGNATETNWKAVGAKMNDVDVWNTLPEHQKYVRIKIRKAGVGVLVMKNAAGEEQTSSFTFTPNHQLSLTPDSNPNGYLGYIDQTDDTSIVLYQYNAYTYKLVKE